MSTAVGSQLAAAFYRMTPLEIAAGWLPGQTPSTSMRSSGAPEPPLAALTTLIRPALLQPPCVVAFSGGRDSSALLAVALDLARREGLDEPLAVSLRYPGVAAADEDGWQERVARHLRVASWERIEVHDELDAVGPIATERLRRFGLLWPPAQHANAPMIALARGGTLLTGEGGDEVFGDRRVSAAGRLLRGRWREWRDDVRELDGCLPGPARRALIRRRRRRSLASGWLRPPARETMADALARDDAAEPLRWPASILRLPRRRAIVEGLRNIASVAALDDVRVVHPFLDPTFLRSLGAVGKTFGFVDRTEAMRHVFGHLLPDDVLARRTKARFNEVMVGPHAREFVDRWTGAGVPHDLVDAEALRAAWRRPVPPAQSLALLQAAWIGEHAA